MASSDPYCNFTHLLPASVFTSLPFPKGPPLFHFPLTSSPPVLTTIQLYFLGFYSNYRLCVHIWRFGVGASPERQHEVFSPSRSGLPCSVWSFLVPSIYLQSPWLHLSPQLREFHSVYALHFHYPFVSCGVFRLFLFSSNLVFETSSFTGIRDLLRIGSLGNCPPEFFLLPPPRPW